MSSKLVALDESFHEESTSNFICPTCGKQLSTASGFRRHVLGHGEKLFQCLICKKKFTERHHYEGHVNRHQKITPYSCLNCKKKFSYKASFNRHKTVCPKEGKKSDPGFECDICKMRFEKKDILRDHVKGKHTPCGLYECDICGKKFRWRSSRAKHRKSSH